MKKVQKSSPIATLDDLKEIANQIVSTLNDSLQEIKSDIYELKGDVAELKGDVSSLKDFRTEQIEANEQIISELKAIREEQATQALHNMRANDTFENHERRISVLETAALA